MAAFAGNKKRFNAGALPDGIFTGCEESSGQTEVIRAPRPWRHGESWIALDIVGAVNFITAAVAIDDHDMWVYAMDGSYIRPQRVHLVTVANGQRYSVLVRLRRGGRFKIRCHASSAPQTLVGHAVLEVSGAGSASGGPSRQWMDLIGRRLSDDVVSFDQSRAAPFPPEPVPPTADALHVLSMRLDGASYRWALNSTSLPPSALESNARPLLFDGAGAGPNVTVATRNGSWVDLVFLAASHPMPPHPIHKHGVKMFQIGAGTGHFHWRSVDDAVRDAPDRFNLVDPPKRDGFLTLPAVAGPSWIVVRYHACDPGAWMLHCHISNHMLGGMMMVILDGVDAWPAIPPEYLEYE